MPHAQHDDVWNKTFPQGYDTLEEGQKFIERCLLLGTTQLLQSRQLLPDNVFKKRGVTNVCRCWAPDPNTFVGNRLMKKLQGAGEAVRDGYLHELIIVVTNNEDNFDDAQEVFTWSVSYTDGNIVCKFTGGQGEQLAKLEYEGADSVKSQTVNLLLRIRKLCRSILLPLAPKSFATLRVTYNETAPAGYQAPGFYRSPTLYDLNPLARTMAVGGVATKVVRTFLSVSSVYLDDETVAAVKLDSGNMSLDSTFYNTTFGIGTPLDATHERPSITIGSPISAKKRSKANATPTEAARKTRGRKNADPKPVKISTPGRSFKLDQKTPERHPE